MSEPKFAIKAEKERQVFVFEVAIVLARKVSLEQAKFIYEYKSKIAVRLTKYKYLPRSSKLCHCCQCSPQLLSSKRAGH